jgi:hypothetical protein
MQAFAMVALNLPDVNTFLNAQLSSMTDVDSA